MLNGLCCLVHRKKLDHWSKITAKKAGITCQLFFLVLRICLSPSYFLSPYNIFKASNELLSFSTSVCMLDCKRGNSALPNKLYKRGFFIMQLNSIAVRLETDYNHIIWQNFTTLSFTKYIRLSRQNKFISREQIKIEKTCGNFYQWIYYWKSTLVLFWTKKEFCIQWEFRLPI